MPRSHVDEAQRRQALAERRFRGHRIRRGLEELGDLDAPKKRKDDVPPAERVTTATTLSDCTTDITTAAARTTPAIFSTVFGADWGEWAEVKRVLFDMNATAAAKRSALETIHVWRQRARKERELPAYVESTEMLLDAMLQDEEEVLKDGPLRMCYGAAISRVVHVMTGSFASGAADTYRKRASEIGFPEEAVEVRQRVAHGALPLASELRWVCGLVLQFLFTQYWLEQERQVHLMQQERGSSSPAAGAHRKPRQRQPARASTATPAVEPSVPAASLPPPSVTIDDMKALLHDLESDADGDGENAKGGGATDKSDKVALVTLSPAGRAPTAEGAARRDTSSGASIATIAGWRLS
ncbi:Las1-like [Leishmania donovani]|uniref:Las1-like family protein n=1 Tax=Leishmania donovani TaxID=5661 RepID=A0A504WW72_LEIDO|nr:Las1-like family protein [Leishmania donovani]CAJ1987606.1 Las1-like [Leishmania donovani]VDZ43494.1 Las1-like_putative/Pfam:PF04031 [Leishmania donovani]